MNNRRWVFVITFLLSFFMVSVSVLAQVSGGTIRGTVTDPQGSVIPNAQVIVSNSATGFSRTIITNESGFYNVPNLTPGNYQALTTASGFVRIQKSFEINVGAEVTADFQLKIGDINQQVVIDNSPPTIEQGSATLSNTVQGRTIRELPLNGRDWTQLAALEPGVTVLATQPSTAQGVTRPNRGWGTQMSISGNRPQQNNYRLDGISINDYSGGAPGSTLGLNLGVDSIQEFSVVTGNAPGEYGKTSGGVFNAITRSGTNQFHGSVFEFYRNDRFDARNFFDKATAPPFTRNQFGGSAGGPIIKDKFFIFGAYEGIRQNLSTTNNIIVPTAAARAGSLGVGTPTPTTITVNAAIVPYLAIYPLPNGTITGDTGIYSFVGTQDTKENFLTLRSDYKISAADTLHGSYMQDADKSIAPDSYNFALNQWISRRKLVSFENTYIFSPSLVNVSRIGYSRVIGETPSGVSGINPLATSTALSFLPGKPIGTLNVSGLTNFPGGLRSSPDTSYRYNSYQAYSDFFYTYGTQSFKFGFAFERVLANQVGQTQPYGQFQFGSLRNFLLNTPQTFIAQLSATSNAIYLRQNIFGFYLQDDWRVRPNLTLNLGLRYEPASVPTEKYNHLSTLLNLTDATPKLGSPYFLNPTLKNFSPRLGLAWDPFKDGKTSVRAGFGLYDQLPLNYQFALIALQAAPYFIQGSVTPPVGSFPTGALALLTPTTAKAAYIQHDPKRSYVMQWNFNVQRELAKDLMLQVGYIGSHGVHLPVRVNDANIVLPTLNSAGQYAFPITTPTPRNGVRLNTKVGTINALHWAGTSSYNGLNVRLIKRLSHRFQGGISYTWGKSLDNSSASVTADNFTNSLVGLPLFDPNLFRGRSDFDVRHSFTANYMINIPGTNGASKPVNAITNGWQLGGIIQASTGQPFSVTISGDALGLRNANTFAFPNRVNSPECRNPVNAGNPINYINTACFTAPAVTTILGNSGRNIASAPNIVNYNMSLVKNIKITKITEEFTVQLRMEAFNIFNHTNFGPPVRPADAVYTFSTASGGRFVPNTGAGLLTSTATTSRQLQFAVKVNW